MTLSVQDLTPISIDVFQFKSRDNPVQKAGEFERILQAEIQKRDTGRDTGAPARNAVSDRKLLEVCYEMESLFIGQMLKTMRNTIMETDFYGKSLVKDIFNDMLYDEYARMMAKTDQFGLARQIHQHVRGV